MRVVKYLEPNSESTPFKDYEISFPAEIGQPTVKDDKIFVIATLELEDMSKYQDRYVVNVGNITSKGFTARVTRLDGAEGWGMTLQLNYLVSTCTIIDGE